ncbi:unnamed protein product, partial [Prunus brigantina]
LPREVVLLAQSSLSSIVHAVESRRLPPVVICHRCSSVITVVYSPWSEVVVVVSAWVGFVADDERKRDVS